MKKITLLLAVLTVSFLAMAEGMSGTYKVGVTEVSPNFSSLSAAATALNTNGVAGHVVLEITSDLTEAANIGLGVNTNGFSITIRPDQDVDRTITFTQATDNNGPSGGFVIGITNVADWTTLLTTDNVTIDGYSVGGTARRLTFKSAAAAHYYTGPICVAGNSNTITIKNIVAKHEAAASAAANNSYCIGIRNRNSSSVNYTPDAIIIENCEIYSNNSTASNAIGFINSGTPTTTSTGCIVRNNTISARHRGIFYSYVTSFEVYGNTIELNQTVSGLASSGIAGNAGNTGTMKIYNNKLLKFKTANTAGGGYGIRGIQASGGGTYLIYNNFITGFETPATGTTEVVGIRVGVGSNVYNNTIVMNDVTTTGAGTTPFAGIVTYSASCIFKNNIIINKEDNFASYCIYDAASNATTSIVSDYNVFYKTGSTNAKIGYYATVAQETLANWQTASEKDANSKSVDVSFVDAATGDLRITGDSEHDDHLAVPRLDEVLTDMFGTSRAAYTYAGAHEAAQPFYWTGTETPSATTRIIRTVSGIEVILENESTIEVYNMNGMMIDKVTTSGTYTRDLNNGVYIIRINGQSTKFIK